MKRDPHPRPLSEALEDHSVEGIAILTSEPVRIARALIWAMVALVVSGLLWSFVGRADVIVSAPGTLSPESEVRRIYTPIDGELADLYIAEGQPVSKGDVLARLNARGAIEAASNALQAQLKLEDAEREWKQFPEKKALMERKAASLKAQLEVEERLHENRVSEGTTKLAEGQKAELDEARSSLDNARRTREAANQELDRYSRLFAQPGGGGIAELLVEQKRTAALEADNAYRVAQSKLAELDFRLSHANRGRIRREAHGALTGAACADLPRTRSIRSVGSRPTSPHLNRCATQHIQRVPRVLHPVEINARHGSQMSVAHQQSSAISVGPVLTSTSSENRSIGRQPCKQGFSGAWPG